jgi:ketosteroid isomerase-like protein
MSQENVEAYKGALEAYERRDIAAFLETLDPEVEWHAAIQMMIGGTATVYCGREAVGEWLRELDDTLSEVQLDVPDIRDLGNQLVAIGHIRTRGRASGAVTESPIGYLIDYRNGKAVRVRSYLDPKEALEAAGLSE